MRNWFNRLIGKKNTPPTPPPAPIAEGESATDFNVNDVVTRMLKNLQAEWETRSVGRKAATDFHFHYQRGDFHVVTSDDRHQARIHFLFFHDVNIGHLDNVRHACNEFNQQYPDFKAIYSLQEERNRVHLHLASSIRLTPWSKDLENDFADTLGLCFEAARQYRRILDGILAEDVSNLEEARALSEREQFLSHELEMQRQQFDMQGHEVDFCSITLGELLRVVFGFDDCDYSRLVLFNDETTTDYGADEIDGLNLATLLVNLNTEIPYFSIPQATLVLDFLRDGTSHTVILHLAAESETSGTLYTRITIVQPDRPLGPNHSLKSRQMADRTAFSLVVGYTKASHHEQEAEFEYLYQEALDAEAKDQDLTAEQAFMLQCANPNVSFSLYWGRRFYLDERYYEALLHLENAYIVQRNNYARLQRRERMQFYELQFYLGQCCLHLNMPQRAYYYLDGLYNRNNLRYTQAYINALVACRDYRALSIIDNVLTNLQRVYDEQEASDADRDRVWHFLLFLRRSKALVLVENEALDEAERMLKALLDDDKAHEHYLLEQLAKIALLRAENATSNNGNNLSISSEFPKPELEE